MIHYVQQYVVAMTTLVRDGASRALLGCCVRPIPPWRACVRGSRSILTCFFCMEQHSCSWRATVRGGHDDIGEGWCFTCPPRMLRPTNVTMIRVCVRKPYSRHLHVPRSLSLCCDSLRATVCGGHDDIGEGRCFTCPPRMLRPTNTAMARLCARQP